MNKWMTKAFLMTMFFLAQTMVSSAQTKLYMEDFTVSLADVQNGKEVSLMLDNNVTATQLQATLELPNGLTYVDGSVAKTSRVKGGDADVQASETTGKLVILATDVDVAAGTGAVVTFILKPAANFAEGVHQIKLSELVVSDENADQLNTVEASTTKVTMLGLGFCKMGAPENIEVSTTKEFQVDVTLDNEGVDNISAIQGKLVLPAGMEIVEGENGKFVRTDRTPSPLTFKVKEFEGYMTFVLSSTRNTVIAGTEGAVFSFTVKAGADLAENSIIKLEDLRIANVDGRTAEMDALTINVLNTTSADEAAAKKVTELNAALEGLTVSAVAKGSDNKAVKDAVAAAEQAAADAKTAVEAVEAVVAKGGVATFNKEALAEAVAAAEKAVADAKTAIEAVDAAFKETFFVYDGIAYIIDAESGLFVAAGHDWGTRGIVNEIGLDLTFASNAETKKVTIDSRVANKSNHFLGTNLYMDSPVAEWILLEQEFGFYISDGAQYLSLDADNNLAMSDDPHLWVIVTSEGVKEARMEELAEASAEKPVDATWMIVAANFNRNDARNAENWIVSADCTNKNLSGGNNVNNCAESWHSTFTISQTIENAPAGEYQLTAQGFYRQDDDLTEDLPVFFANDVTKEFMPKEGTENSMSDASASFTEGKYTIEPIAFKVGTDGVMTIGVKGTATHQWVIFDNFQLTYLGPSQESAISSVNVAEGQAVYYDLSGRRVVKPASNQVYIVKHQNGSVVKKIAK